MFSNFMNTLDLSLSLLSFYLSSDGIYDEFVIIIIHRSVVALCGDIMPPFKVPFKRKRMICVLSLSLSLLILRLAGMHADVKTFAWPNTPNICSTWCQAIYTFSMDKMLAVEMHCIHSLFLRTATTSSRALFPVSMFFLQSQSMRTAYANFYANCTASHLYTKNGQNYKKITFDISLFSRF